MQMLLECSLIRPRMSLLNANSKEKDLSGKSIITTQVVLSKEHQCGLVLRHTKPAVLNRLR